MDYHTHVLPLAVAVTSAAFAWKLQSLGNRSARSSVMRLPVFHALRKAVHTFAACGRYSPVLKHRSSALSVRSEGLTKASRDSLDERSQTSMSRNSPMTVTPLKLQRPCSALSVDLSEVSRSTSSLRLETDRVNRMSRYCESLERKAEWLEQRELRKSELRRSHDEELQELKRHQRLEEDFKRRLEAAEKRKKEHQRKEKEMEVRQSKAKALETKGKAALQHRDDLSRSAAKSSLTAFTKERQAAILRKEQIERAQSRKEFYSVMKSSSTHESVSYAESLHHDLSFQLRQAVTRNQEIVKRIVGTGYLQV